MNATLTIAILVIIVILIAWYTTSMKTDTARQRKRAKKIEVISELDEPNERQTFLEEVEAAPPDDLDADDLFTQATLYLRMQDDIQDKLQTAPAHLRSRLMQQLSQVTNAARISIRQALGKRNNENQEPQAHATGGVVDAAPIFYDDAIQLRADEIEEQAALIAPFAPIVPLAPPTPIAPAAPAVPAAHVLRPKWTPDPENVHDSAVGEGINRRLDYLRAGDLHLIRPSMTLGTIMLLMNQRLDKVRDAEKRSQIMKTLNMAQHDDYCQRYNTGELNAIRLVLEHAYHAETEDKKNNLHDALLSAIADCAYKHSDGTVCLIGRISRYAASLDGVDDAVADTIKPVDAYRAEILNSVGKLSATGVDGEELIRHINQTCDQYKGKIPDHSLQKIRKECLDACV